MLLHSIFYNSHLVYFMRTWMLMLWSARPADTDVFKTSSGCLKKVTTSLDQTRRRHYVWKKTSNLQRRGDIWFTSASRRPIYDVLKTSVKRRLCSNVVATSIKRRKKLFFLILYCLKYSENFKFSSLGYYLGMEFCTNQWTILYMIATSVMKELILWCYSYRYVP